MSVASPYATAVASFSPSLIVGYVLVAGIFYGIFYKWQKKKWQNRKLATKDYTSRQLRREIGWSLLSAGCFALTASIMLLLWQKGLTQIYTIATAYPLWWLPVSLVIALLIDETYYYWMHRWMHRPGVFKRIHKVHHQSHITSPWTAASFHPVEALLLSLPLLFTVLCVPMHIGVILVQLLIMTFSSVFNHLNIQVFSHGDGKNKLRNWLIGPGHHSQHHKQFKYNFGLYFTFWDRLKKTESPSSKSAEAHNPPGN